MSQDNSMFSIPADWRGFILWAAITILVAVIANLATPRFQAWGAACLKIMMQIAALGKRSIVDFYYIRAAQRPSFSALPLILYLGVSGSIGMRIAAYQMAPMVDLTHEELEKLKDQADAKPQCKPSQVLIWGFRSVLRQECRPNSSTFRLLVTLAFGLTLVMSGALLIRYNVVKSIVSGFDQSLEAILSSISEAEERSLRSRFAQMSGAGDYKQLKTDLKGLAVRGGVRLPDTLF
jgi:hypothetical protein